VCVGCVVCVWCGVCNVICGVYMVSVCVCMLEALKTAAGASAMNVDGSSSSKIFKWDVPATEDWFLKEIRFFILDPGVMLHNEFGSLGLVLSTGLKMVVKRKAVENNVTEMFDNTDLLMTFPDKIVVGNNANAFLNENDYFFGALVFDEPTKMKGPDGDLVKIVVRDDLRLIETMRAQVKVKRYL